VGTVCSTLRVSSAAGAQAHAQARDAERPATNVPTQDAGTSLDAAIDRSMLDGVRRGCDARELQEWWNMRILTVFGTATIDDATITGNTASSGDNNVDGTFSM
jgi:hypothetical protein